MKEQRIHPRPPEQVEVNLFERQERNGNWMCHRHKHDKTVDNERFFREGNHLGPDTQSHSFANPYRSFATVLNNLCQRLIWLGLLCVMLNSVIKMF